MTDHIVKSYDDEQRRLLNETLRMGEMAASQPATPARQPLFRGNFRHNKQSGGRAERRRKVVG